MVVTRSHAVTRGVRVEVKARYSQEHSDPGRPLWFFLYTITIENMGQRPVQLINRHWEITDGNGRVEHVRGPGVVGKQPLLGPGESFEYTSGCPLPTPFGFMKGEYQMYIPAADEWFDVEVAGFPLRISDGSLN
ncbi:MAG TPA: Co2+/Mg2+ efflux protein ApaG [Polyangiaceae bacterium]|nr:Co2+/Mg2+ efflux protein ApaG [Polyangiaceae bacterium]